MKTFPLRRRTRAGAAAAMVWCSVFLISVILWAPASYGGEPWTQWKFDSRHSGDAGGRSIRLPLGLVGTVPLTDAVFTAPVVADGRIYVVDGAGVAFSIDASTLQVVWRFASPGGAANCNNASSPALADGRLHFGTMAGRYYVLDAKTGSLIREIACGDPIFGAPVVSQGRVYFATLGARLYALTSDGKLCWTWDFVREVLKFPGDRWLAQDWLDFKKGRRVTYADQFCATADPAADGKRIVLPAGGRLVFVNDAGDRGEVEAISPMPAYAGSEPPAIFGLSIGGDGTAYAQWHRRDNAGRVEAVRLRDGKVETDFVRGTRTAINLPGLMSFCSVSVRGKDVFRCRPEEGMGLCRHGAGEDPAQCLSRSGSIAPPVLLASRSGLGDLAVYGGLDGNLYAVRLDGAGQPWSFKTAFGRAITAPVAVCDGRVYFGCEDGYLYVLGPEGRSALPAKDLGLHKIRSPLTSKLAAPQYDWATNYGNLANTNSNSQGIKPPLKMKWIRRYEGTFKHLPVCGGGRMYMHTAEGQVMAVEQETGRLLWRRWWPGVYLSFTSPIYSRERLLVPQAGMKQSRLRCLDAGTGELRWEAPFTGSPSWSRQGPPVLYKNLAMYGFGSGRYAAQGSEKAYVFSGTPAASSDGAEVMSWMYTHDNPHYPQDNLPRLRAWDIDTGQEAWSLDFSAFGRGGNDYGLCLMGETLYYSTFFGYAPRRFGQAAPVQPAQPPPNGLTVAIEPQTGKILWRTTAYSTTAGCALAGRDGRLYLGGYNRPNEQTKDRYVHCLDARDGSLVWRSDPLSTIPNVVTVGEKHVFTNAYCKDGCVLDKQTGKIVSRFNYGYACTRFTLSEPYLLGTNMDMIDLSAGNRLVSTGPPLDPRECVGAVASNGRLFFVSQASGLQACQTCGEEAAATVPPWQAR